METIEIARRMAELNQAEDACDAYTLILHGENASPEEQFEAALYILQAGGDYKISYTCFLDLYRRGFHSEEILALLTGAFYEPNEKELRSRYERNCKLLKKYPYLFRKDFPAFEDLPIHLYPYSENAYIPFDVRKNEFGELIDTENQVITRNFFKDLENPILAADVYSQYELEYLCDNVRKSEYVARENHIYLHYTAWDTFCSYLQCLNIRPLLEEKKIVFLIEDEIEQYPIDFKERFGIDYSRFHVKPVELKEITRMIWLCQLSSHNGINFFGEIFDSHPNLITVPAMNFQDITEKVNNGIKFLRARKPLNEMRREANQEIHPRFFEELYRMKNVTEKDVMVTLFIADERYAGGMDAKARIAPALLFQPHFGNIAYDLTADEKNRTLLFSEEYEEIRTSPMFRGFKYIKTVAPFRRPTTSYSAAVRFSYNDLVQKGSIKDENGQFTAILDEITRRILSRGFMIDCQDRLINDSILVRFEDAKLNPTATFTALAAFLDIPYTESMTYCSGKGERDPETLKGDARGFDLRAVYETYDEFANDVERYFIEYFMRDVYETYGYDFQYYDGASVDEGKAAELIDGFTTIDSYTKWSVEQIAIRLKETDFRTAKEKWPIVEEKKQKAIERYLKKHRRFRLQVAKLLLRGLHFVNRNGQPLQMMPKLELDPSLLEQPLYR